MEGSKLLDKFKWINDISWCLFVWFFFLKHLLLHIKAVWNIEAFTVAVNTSRVVFSFACLCELPESSCVWVLCCSSVKPQDAWPYFFVVVVKCICNSLQVNCDSLVFECITKRILAQKLKPLKLSWTPPLPLFFLTCTYN